MVNRPQNWDQMTMNEKMAWLRDQRHQPRKGIGGPRYKLKEKDKERVWRLIVIYRNQSIVAEMLSLSRRTLIRFLKRHPIPDSFEVEKRVEMYHEIRIWVNRQRAFSKKQVTKQYLRWIRHFHNWQKEKNPTRVRPKLWTSDDILEWVNAQPDHLQYEALTPLRQLANKCQIEFPFIDLSLLPVRRFYMKKRSLAGKTEYYLDIGQVRRMKQCVPDHELPKGKRNAHNDAPLLKARNKAIISWLFNTAVRTGSHTMGEGLLGIRIENLHLEDHWARVKDKGDIWWHVKGLCDTLIQETKEYLGLRGTPKKGWLWLNDYGKPMKNYEVNAMLKEAGGRARIKGKKISCRTFRKSFVKHVVDVLKVNPMFLIGTGKNPKTCFCVGWTDVNVLMEHYAPELERVIERIRQKFKL